MISFEFPIAERIRLLLRLEDLFQRLAHFMERGTPTDHHAALLSLFEISEIGARSDVKGELLQELDRQKHALDALRDNPAIAEDALDAVLADIEAAMSGLFDSTSRVGQHLRENEWLSTIRQRSGIPGGVCEFDLPSYHFWLHRPDAMRRADVDRWYAPLKPARAAADVLLQLLRDNGKTYPLVARGGNFQQMSGGRIVHMIRIVIAELYGVVPELSANKYAINVRFVQPGTGNERPRPVGKDIEFTLTYCKL